MAKHHNFFYDFTKQYLNHEDNRRYEYNYLQQSDLSVQFK